VNVGAFGGNEVGRRRSRERRKRKRDTLCIMGE